MPLLADDYGLYYNKDLFAQAGIKSPAEDVSPSSTPTRRSSPSAPAATIDVAGLRSHRSAFYENAAAHYAPHWDAQWFDAEASRRWRRDPAWADDARPGTRTSIDWYGYDNLTRFQAGAGDEFSASNAFETGKVAMIIDGEYRTAFIKDEHPELNYGTAPIPVADDQQDRYGAGYVTGSIIGIPKGSSNQAAAWELDQVPDHQHRRPGQARQRAGQRADDAGSGEVAEPAPRAAVRAVPRRSSRTRTRRPTRSKASGAPTRSSFESFIVEVARPARSSDLQAGLEDVAKQIDAQEQNASGGQAP